MALHGTVAINGRTLLNWSAQRIADGLGDNPNTYKVMVFDGDPLAPQWERYAEDVTYEFEVKHTYEDGPAVLGAKVLKEYSKRARKTYTKQLRTQSA